MISHGKMSTSSTHDPESHDKNLVTFFDSRWAGDRRVTDNLRSKYAEMCFGRGGGIT